MSYHISKTVEGEFNAVVERVRTVLKKHKFGVITEIDVQKTLKEKIGAEFRSYVILGACNPTLAHAVLEAEDHIGLMLPCNVTVQQRENGVEVSAIEPAASMAAVENPVLTEHASEVGGMLAAVIEEL